MVRFCMIWLRVVYGMGERILGFKVFKGVRGVFGN